MHISQEHFTATVYAKFRGENIVHYGELENREFNCHDMQCNVNLTICITKSSV